MKILIADDHRMVREGLRAILEREALTVVGEASNGREVLALAPKLRPDVVVMDVYMPELNGVDATRQLLGVAPDVRVLGLSVNGDRRCVVAMLEAGASGYLLKSASAQELTQAVAAVAAGYTYLSPSIASVVVANLTGSGVAERPRRTNTPPGFAPGRRLSAREREVLQLIAEGKSTKEIATSLLVASTTVDTHRRQIMHKLGLRTVAELTKYAIREGLTPLD